MKNTKISKGKGKCKGKEKSKCKSRDKPNIQVFNELINSNKNNSKFRVEMISKGVVGVGG